MSASPDVTPSDEHNLKLLANVHPPDWVNPAPAQRYNLVVVSAGTAGLVSAAGAAGLGAKVALVERHLIWGDCLNVGCVPSKTIIRAAKALADVRDASRFGVHVPAGAGADFPAVMERVRRIRARISPHDSARRFRDEYGVDVFLGEGRFVGKDTVDVGAARLRAGDICSPYKFTHAADFMARAVIQNAFFGFAGKKKVSSLTIPWCTYTDPEIAHVGLYERDAAARGIEVQTFTVPMSDVDRAIAEGEEEGSSRYTSGKAAMRSSAPPWWRATRAR